MGFLRNMAKGDLPHQILTAVKAMGETPRQQFAFDEDEMGSPAQLQADAVYQQYGDKVTEAIRLLGQARNTAIDAGPRYVHVVKLIERITESYMMGEDTRELVGAALMASYGPTKTPRI